MNKNIVIVVGIFVIAIAGYFAFSGNKVDQNNVANEEGEVTSNMPVPGYDVSDMLVEDEQNGEVTSNMPVQGIDVPEMIVESEPDITTTIPGSYIAYSADKLAMAEAGDVVIFFHASWCPSCRGLNADIEKNISSIPDGVTILKADYDKETEMKKKYGVTTQHTLVQVDKDGNLIKKWSGGSKLENLLSEIQ